MNPPIYIINWKHDKERWQSMKRQLDQFGLSYERIEADAGRDFTAEQRSAVYSGFWYKILCGKSASRGELGATLSHRQIWQLMLDRNQDWAIIFEDDVQILPEFARDLIEMEEETRNFDLVQFHSFRMPNIAVSESKSGGFKVKKYSGAHASAAAYGIRSSGARKLLRQRKVIYVVDKWVWATALVGLSCCGINPLPVKLHPMLSIHSTIGTTQSGRSRSGLWLILVLPILRVVRTVMSRARGF